MSKEPTARGEEPSLPYMDVVKDGTATVHAGRLPEEMYTKALNPWRAAIRRQMVEIVKVETPVLAKLQAFSRTPFLDAYFVYTSMLGTHTFFMMFLPTLFFFGHDVQGRGLIFVLALGVYSSSLLKDFVCSPRPFALPVTRLSVGSHHLEYGLPSTHTTNAVSMALFLLGLAYDLFREEKIGQNAFSICSGIAAFYVLTIAGGRLYTGMHGFVDVTIGGLLGLAMSLVQIYWLPYVERWVVNGGWYAPLVMVVVGLLLVHKHPQPVDDCPCFEDAIAFNSVVLGILLGLSFSVNFPALASPTSLRVFAPSDLPSTFNTTYIFTPAAYDIGAGNVDVTAVAFMQYLLVAATKLIGGILAIFAFRLIMKPFLHAVLPPIYRFLAHTVPKFLPGWDLPTRRYYTPATEYGRMPPYGGHEGAGMHDGGLGELRPVPSMVDLSLELSGAPWEVAPNNGMASGHSAGGDNARVGNTMTRRAVAGGNDDDNKAEFKKYVEANEGGGEVEETEVVKHYDADVLTKFIVYTGIGFMAQVVCPATMEAVGLGVVSRL